jgi:hypothetical protein
LWTGAGGQFARIGLRVFRFSCPPLYPFPRACPLQKRNGGRFQIFY